MNIQADLSRFPTRLHEDWRYFRMKEDDLKNYLEEGHLPQSGSRENISSAAIRQLDVSSKQEAEALFRHSAFQFQDDTFSQLVGDYATPEILILQGTAEGFH